MENRYDKYKDSGIAWIGEIPEHWGSRRIKTFSLVKRGASPRPIDDPKYFDENGEFAWVRIADVSASGKYLECTTQKLSKLGSSLSVKRYPGDIFISIAGTVGKPIITNIKCCIHDGFVYFPNMKGISVEYLYYVFLSGQPYLGLGKMGTQLNLNTETIGNIYIPYPNIVEQTKIVYFLCQKCGEIDELITLQEEMITKLQSYKQSVITEAVTKGLDKNVPLKDSGIKWIGKIPEHWEASKTLFVLSMSITDGPHTTPELFETGIPFVSAEAVSFGNGRIDFSHIRGYISEIFYQECCKKYIPQIDDIYMIKSGATTGRVAIVDADIKFTIWSPLAVFRCNKERMLPRFLFYQLQSNGYQKQIELNWSYGTQQNIGMRTLEKLILSVPPLPEQYSIADYLDKKCSEIDELISIKQQKIEKLKEYKKSLIFECVTGKRKVS